jgi:hypothetical protein
MTINDCVDIICDAEQKNHGPIVGAMTGALASCKSILLSHEQEHIDVSVLCARWLRMLYRVLPVSWSGDCLSLLSAYARNSSTETIRCFA